MISGKKRRIEKAALFLVSEKIREEIKRKNPGYTETNEKISVIAQTLTGVRLLYGIFFAGMCVICGFSLMQGIMMLISPFVVYVWYGIMLRSGRFPAIAMLCARAYSIITGGAALLSLGVWLPFPLLFALTAAAYLEFAEAVFCIYLLFDREAVQTIRLNRKISRLSAGCVVYSAPSQTDISRGKNPDEKQEKSEEEKGS